jgi:HSP20 family protein
MASFFEKLKKGMGIDELESPVEVAEEKEEVPEPVKAVPKKSKSSEKAKGKKKLEEKKEIENGVELEPEPKTEKIEEEKIEEKKDKWSNLNGEQEGQLAVDVYQTDKDLVIQSAIAGVEIGNLNISIEKDIVTIKGWRGKQSEEAGDYFTQECHWGPFSREVILPVEVDPGRIEATMKEGILTVRIPKIIREKKIKISIKNI